MKHKSIPLESPIEMLAFEPLNPLISKCQIKVCYVSDQPNRNHSVITKEVATEMAASLPGCPIVGYYNEATGDFEEHNRTIEISNGEFKIKDTTVPYGFVDINAKVWFQKFQDDDEVEREYLMTEGYLWTSTYPECQRVIDKGNNQSMELDEKSLKADWSKDEKGLPQFFIINEALISKLCILGENCEPCFEGAQISKVQFSFDDNFKNQLFSMVNELKELLQSNKGGAEQMYTRYAVEIGDQLWSAIYDYLFRAYPDAECEWSCPYRIEGIYEEGEQKFAVLQERKTTKLFRLNFSMTAESGFVAEPELVLVEKKFDSVEEAQFSVDAVEAFETEFAAKKKEEDEKKKKNEDNSEQKDDSKNDNKSEDASEEEICPECGKPVSECTCGDKKKKKDYCLDEIEEYVALTAQFAELQTKYDALIVAKEELENQLAPLVEFKKNSERKEKEAMIASFYMLSDDDKKDVSSNIDTYSLEDIEAKLSIICVRNKVSFNLDDDKNPEGSTTFNLNGVDSSNEETPAWVKAALNVAKSMN